MDRHTPERFEEFERTVTEFPEVVECLLVTGQSADYQLRVRVPDMEEYQAFLLNKITRIEGVTDVHSSFIMREVVSKTEMPLNHMILS
jgi:Lrp/AsnC family leucine-responsive transcriptional regulator